MRRNLISGALTWLRRVKSPTAPVGNGVETPIAGIPDRSPESPDSDRDPYRGVIIVLLVAAFLGTAAIIVGNTVISNPILLDVAVTLFISAGILLGVALAQIERANPPKPEAANDGSAVSPVPAAAEETKEPAPSSVSAEGESSQTTSPTKSVRSSTGFSFWDFGLLREVRFGTAAIGLFLSLLLFLFNYRAYPPTLLMAVTAAVVCLGAAALLATVARYFADIDSAKLPEGPGLCRWARVVAWMFVVAAVSVGLAWAGQHAMLRILHLGLLAINAAVCISLIRSKQVWRDGLEIFPLDLGVLSALGSRANIFASILDAGERQLGIDLRSTWALTVVRQSVEPLAIGLLLLGWLSTSLTVVGIQDQGLIERLGVPVEGATLMPGLHLHWPWPIDRVFRIPVQKAQSLEVGHEGEEGGGPENVLWAVEHAPNEYTLVLGNGRDLITVDAAVQYRIIDPRAWHYHSQNPETALRAIAYRAVMRSTVDRTLSETLSENLTKLTEQMRGMVQQDANALVLGVDVIGFTVGGMHPPVPVAADYEAVVSAELGKVTAVVNAQAYRNQVVPAAEATVIAEENTARAEGAQALSLAAGEAWSFRTLESQYRAAPGEYFFRRRLETLEAGLTDGRFTILDSRFQRDGGELWLER